MAAYLIPEVWCDVCLDRNVSEDVGTIRAHRAYLREDCGWVRRMPITDAELEAWDQGEGTRFVDVCPDCQEKP